MAPACTLIATVLNEANTIDRLLESLAQQTRAPEEIIVVDGGSTDDTPKRLAAWQSRLPLQVVLLPGANIAQGRNAAIALATGAVIAVTDAGVRLSEGWLEALLLPFGSAAPPDVVAGFFRADPRSTFELAMGVTVLPQQSEIDPEHFLPSSRSVAFTRDAWQRAGGYPEWLDYCEDVVFDLRLKQLGSRFAWAPEAVAHFRPRSSFGAFFRQYFLYARGDGKAGLWPWRHAARYAAYLLASAALSPARSPLLGMLVTLGGAYYLYRPYARLLPALAHERPTTAAQAVALVPLIRFVGDVAKMVGYPVGLLWRSRHGQRHDAR